MESQITEVRSSIPNVDAQLMEYMDTSGLTKQLNPKEKAMFINMAKAYGLNPFKREIYCTVYGQGEYRQCSIVTGYEVYLKRAERTGKLDGWECSFTGSVKNNDLQATVIIYRKDWSHPFRHTALYEECVQKTFDKKTGQERPNKVWQKMPTLMTRKVAEAQAFRLCFPDELGGMPYSDDEMGVEIPKQEAVVNITPSSTAVDTETAQSIQSAQNAQQGEWGNKEKEAIDNSKDNGYEENSQKLLNLLKFYNKKIDARAQSIITDAVASESNEKVLDALKRIKIYLGRKGINI